MTHTELRMHIAEELGVLPLSVEVEEGVRLIRAIVSRPGHVIEPGVIDGAEKHVGQKLPAHVKLTIEVWP